MRTVADSILTFGDILLWRLVIKVKRTFFFCGNWSWNDFFSVIICTKAWWLPKNGVIIIIERTRNDLKGVEGQQNSNGTVTKTTFSQTERTDNLLHVCSSNFNEQLPCQYISRSPRLSRKQMSYLLLLHFEVACGCWKTMIGRIYLHNTYIWWLCPSWSSVINNFGSKKIKLRCLMGFDLQVIC